jgi:hypothetical protein
MLAHQTWHILTDCMHLKLCVRMRINLKSVSLLYTMLEKGSNSGSKKYIGYTASNIINYT